MRDTGGQCTGYKNEDIKNFFPRDLHPNMTDADMPRQNSDLCHLDHALMKFDARSSSEASLAVCYSYTFNVRNTVKRGQDLPCGLHWSDIDVVLSIPSREEIFQHYVPLTAPADYKNNPIFSRIKFVFTGQIYGGYLKNLMAEATARNAFTPLHDSDYLSKYGTCDKEKPDIHYRLPGVPDYALTSWLHLIRSGLVDKEYKVQDQLKYWE